MAETQEKIELLKKIAHRFHAAQIEWALGASMMLYFKGLSPAFHDIDLMVSEQDAERAGAILSEMGKLCPPCREPDPRYRTKVFLEFTIDAIGVDVMAGFGIVRDGEFYDCALKQEKIAETLLLGTERIPLQSPLLWCRYDRLMGRDEKADRIERALASQ